MVYADFVKKCIKEYKETENEFIYQLIAPFSDTVVEKTLSKKELKKILLKGMQKSIPLEQVKQAREEMKECSYSLACFNEDVFDEDERVVDLDDVLIILDRLIGSEEK